MNTLKLFNKKYFSNSLKAFSKKTQVTFDINHDALRISSLDSPFIYLSFESDLFSIDSPVSFTIRIDEFTKNLNLLNGSSIFIGENTLKMSDDDCYIEIPFLNPIQSYYFYCDSFSTKVLIPKDSLKNFISGKVHYYLNGNSLFIKNNRVDGFETLEINGEFLQNGYLDFYCYNDWIEYVLNFYELIDTVMLCFTDDLLSVKFILKEYTSVYLEIQVRRIS